MKKSLGKILLAPVVLGLSLSLAPLVQAEIQTDVINEKWGKPTLVYGGGLSDAQATEVNNLFGISDVNNVSRQVVVGTDMDQYLGTSEADTASSIHLSWCKSRTLAKGLWWILRRHRTSP